MSYNWLNQKLDNYIADCQSRYEEIKKLSYNEKIYIFKYAEESYYYVQDWDKCDIDLFNNINNYVNKNINNKLFWAERLYRNSLKHIYQLFDEMSQDDFNNINLFYYFTLYQLETLKTENIDIYNNIINKIKNKYPDGMELLTYFIPEYHGEFTMSEVRKLYRYSSVEKYKKFSFIMKVIRFINSIYNLDNDKFYNYLNGVLYAHFCLTDHNTFNENISNEEKELINKAFYCKTKIKNKDNINYILNLLHGYITEDDERCMLSKLNYKDAFECTSKEKINNYFDNLNITHIKNIRYANSIKFKILLK